MSRKITPNIQKPQSESLDGRVPYGFNAYPFRVGETPEVAAIPVGVALSGIDPRPAGWDLEGAVSPRKSGPGPEKIAFS